VVQVILPSKQDMQPEPPPLHLDAKHKAIAEAYGIPIVDAGMLAYLVPFAG